jgi:hypothetical protein
MLKKQYDVACPKLAESYQQDPLPGVLFTLAECEAGWQKLATALGHYQVFVSALTTMSADRRATFEERRSIAAGQIAVLSVSAPELTVDVPTRAPGRLLIQLDGRVIPEGAYGVGRKVDPGSYTVSAELDGKRVWDRQVTLEPANQAHVTVDVGARVPAAADRRDTTEPSTARSKPLGTWAYVAGGLGIAGLATGVIGGALAYQKKGTIDRNCPDLRCNAEGRTALDSARAEAQVSTLGFSLGVVGAGAFLLLRVLSPTHASPNQAPSSKRAWSVASTGTQLDLAMAF